MGLVLSDKARKGVSYVAAGPRACDMPASSLPLLASAVAGSALRGTARGSVTPCLRGCGLCRQSEIRAGTDVPWAVAGKQVQTCPDRNFDLSKAPPVVLDCAAPIGLSVQ